MVQSTFSVQNQTIKIDLDTSTGVVTFWNLTNGHRLFISSGADLLCPVIDGKKPALSLAGVTKEAQTLRVRFTGDIVSSFQLCLDCSRQEVRLSSSFCNQSGRELNALSMLPQHSKINMYDLVNFRNHHGTPSTWPELCLADEVKTTTYSVDWQFSPHPTMLIFRKNETNLLCASLDMPKGFGFVYHSNRYDLADWYLDYGPVGNGEKLCDGQTWHSPVFCLLKTEHRTVFDTIDAYCNLLVEGGYIPDPAARTRYRWHKDNLYCTWVDQGYLCDSTMIMELQDQQNAPVSAGSCLNEALVRRAANTIRREHLPITTILIDDGWQKALGEWEVDTKKFPDFRGLIEDLHAMGFKVILWVNFADIVSEAQINEAYLCQGFINRHGRRFWDFSNPTVQKEYLEPLMRKICSPEEDCYNADGIKTDFLADKIHPETPCDPQWRGEENYFLHLYRCFYSYMKKYKPDACHIGCAGHPYLGEYMDIIRTYDIFTSNFNEHLERGRMVHHCSAGVPVAFDFHNLTENFDDYFTVAHKNGCAVEIGNILGKKVDYFSPWEPANQVFYDQLRRGLRKFL